jgi:hypothetical protein
MKMGKWQDTLHFEKVARICERKRSISGDIVAFFNAETLVSSSY